MKRHLSTESRYSTSKDEENSDERSVGGKKVQLRRITAGEKERKEKNFNNPVLRTLRNVLRALESRSFENGLSKRTAEIRRGSIHRAHFTLDTRFFRGEGTQSHMKRKGRKRRLSLASLSSSTPDTQHGELKRSDQRARRSARDMHKK